MTNTRQETDNSQWTMTNIDSRNNSALRVWDSIFLNSNSNGVEPYNFKIHVDRDGNKSGNHLLGMNVTFQNQEAATDFYNKIKPSCANLFYRPLGSKIELLNGFVNPNGSSSYIVNIDRLAVNNINAAIDKLFSTRVFSGLSKDSVLAEMRCISNMFNLAPQANTIKLAR